MSLKLYDISGDAYLAVNGDRYFMYSSSDVLDDMVNDLFPGVPSSLPSTDDAMFSRLSTEMS